MESLCKWYEKIQYTCEVNSLLHEIDDSECCYEFNSSSRKDYVGGVKCNGDKKKCLIPPYDRNADW